MSDPEAGGPFSDIDVDAATTEPPDPTPAGAPDDEEMPLTEHVEEMVHRLGVVVVAMAVVSAVTFPLADRLIDFLWFSILPGSTAACPPPGGVTATQTTGPTQNACPRLYHPLALLLARLKVASLTGFIVALPVFVYQTYLFMRPGLYPRERRYYLAAVPTSIVLAAVGVAFAFLLVLPAIFTYFLYYSEEAAVIAFGLSETFNLIVMMLGMFAFIFQIPLFVMLALMMGITSRRWLESRRLYFWGGFATVAFLFAPDPTGMAPIIVAATMIVLFEGTLRLVRWTGEDSLVPTARGIRQVRPAAWLLAGLAGYAASSAPFPRGYYGSLPPAVTDALANANLTGATPYVVAGALIVLYEALQFLLRRQGASFRTRLRVARLRVPAWALAAVVGYLLSPDPVLLRLLDRTYLPDAYAVALALSVVVVYEVVLLAWRYRERGSVR